MYVHKIKYILHAYVKCESTVSNDVLVTDLCIYCRYIVPNIIGTLSNSYM